MSMADPAELIRDALARLEKYEEYAPLSCLHLHPETPGYTTGTLLSDTRAARTALLAALTPPAPTQRKELANDLMTIAKNLREGRKAVVMPELLEDAAIIIAVDRAPRHVPPAPASIASADAEKLVDNLIVEARGYERLADVYNDELLRDARAAVLSAMRGTTWQPIETAPKDARWVLLYQPGYEWAKQGPADIYIAQRNPPQWRLTSGAGTSPGESKGPTHWMPLPAAPETPR